MNQYYNIKSGHMSLLISCEGGFKKLPILINQPKHLSTKTKICQLATFFPPEGESCKPSSSPLPQKPWTESVCHTQIKW